MFQRTKGYFSSAYRNSTVKSRDEVSKRIQPRYGSREITRE